MKANRRQQQNKKAFDRVMKEYLNRNLTSRVGVIDTSVETKGKVNPAAPTDSDFFADCALAWESALDIDWNNDADLFMMTKFAITYLTDSEHDRLTEGEQKTVEQKVGREFIRRGLYPPESYFKTEKK